MNFFDRPVVGPYSLRGLARGLKEAVITPVEQEIYDTRKAYPVADMVASFIPPYGVAAAVQDAARAATNEDAVVDLAGALPAVKMAKGLRAAAKELGRTTRTGAPQLYAYGAAGATPIVNDRINDFEEAQRYQEKLNGR